MMRERQGRFLLSIKKTPILISVNNTGAGVTTSEPHARQRNSYEGHNHTLASSLYRPTGSGLRLHISSSFLGRILVIR